MVNRFFTDDMMALLTAPERWRIVSSLFPADVHPIAHPRHQRWLQSHTHTHDYQEIIVGLQGHSTHGFCGEIYPFDPGGVFVFDLFEAHDSRYPRWSPEFAHLWIHTLPDHVYIRYVTNTSGQRPVAKEYFILPCDEIGINVRAVLFNRKYLEHLTPPARRFSFCSGLGTILSYLIRIGFSAPAEDDVEVFQQRVIASVQQHIEDTAGKGVTLEQLAELSGYSRSHFTRLFRQFSGVSVHEYIDQCRIRKICELLARGCSKKTISSELGFSSPTSFARWCRQRRCWIDTPNLSIVRLSDDE